ncbi:MAG: pseudouridine synthase [Thermonemataceae bacterium]|nr:pseudouridine synthase [Thermonemataceae bacterium]
MKEGKPKKQQTEGKFPKERVKKSGNQVRKKGSSSEKEETKTFSNKRVFKSDKPKEQVFKNKFSKPFSKTKEKALDVEKENIQDWRLNKYIANAGICSRREADELIAKGLIKVNGKVVVEMGYKVKPQDKVMYQNKLLSLEKSVYILLNKPKNFITTTEDPEERKTVMELIKNACEERVYPVGRLDRHTTGLLLFTNDGDLAKKLSHPSSNIKKVYQVMIDKPITETDFIKIQEGLTLEDGFIKVDALAVLDRNVLGVELHSGRNRIVRRIFEHLGYQVEKLDRTMYAGLSKKDLPRGKWRFLTEKEVILLKHFTKKK